MAIGTTAGYASPHARNLIAIVIAGIMLSNPRVTFAKEPNAKAPAARASASARALFEQGRTHFKAGRYKQAATRFHAAFELSPRGLIKFNEAQAWARAKVEARAADAYEAALESEDLAKLDAQWGASAQQQLAKLKRRLGYLVVAHPLGGTIEIGDRHALIPAKLHIVPGANVITLVSAEGRQVERTIHIRAAERKVLERVEELEPTEISEKPSPVSIPLPNDDTNTDALPIAGYTLIGIGTAFGVAIIPLGLTALRANNRWDESGLTDVSAREQAVTLRVVTNIAVAAAVVSGGVGLTLLLWPGENDDDASQARSVRARFGPTGATLVIPF